MQSCLPGEPLTKPRGKRNQRKLGRYCAGRDPAGRKARPGSAGRTRVESLPMSPQGR